MKLAVYNRNAEEAGSLEVSDAVFGLKWNADLVHQVVISQAANLRSPVAHAKTRGEVSGGGKKPWRQKGTGRARHGSIRSPIWVGGGVAHGPRKDKVLGKKINRKMARRALFTVLSAKARDNEIIVVDDLSLSDGKTKSAAEIFRAFAGKDNFAGVARGNGVLAVLPERAAEAKRALRNLPYAGTEEARNLNAWKAMQYRYLMIPKDALGVFEKEK